MHPALPLTHLLLALAVVAVWGTNFVVIKLALADLPPLLFATLRFLFALLPAAFVLPRPAVPWHELAAYGVLIGAGQFGLLYIAMHGHISPGLASLVVQTQVFFTIGLSMWIAHERLQRHQVVALAIALAGLAVIVAHTDASTTVLGLVLVLLAALAWAGGNLVARRAVGANMLAYVVWASLFSIPPLLVLSLLFEGPAAIAHGLREAGPLTWAAVLWQSAGNTLFGYAAWAWLLARHPAATVSPMALLVPVFGMGASAWWLDEAMPAWKLIAAALVLAGLAINVLWPRWRAKALLRAGA
ncbi:putative amino-acid metabolite efflux pump [Burkholderiaceae bacterium]|nr:putative amino-acid metabolite efflux pump [Burkholderiaceae bacterium]